MALCLGPSVPGFSRHGRVRGLPAAYAGGTVRSWGRAVRGRGAHPRGRSSRPRSGPRRAGSAPSWSRCRCRASHTPGTACCGGRSGLRGGGGPRHTPPSAGPEAGRRGGGGQGSRTLTAEAGAPPVQGPPAGVGTLAGVLGERGADTAGQVGVLAQAQVLLAGAHVAAGVHQGVAAQEPLTQQQLLAEALGQSGHLSPGSGPGSPVPSPRPVTPARPGPATWGSPS